MLSKYFTNEEISGSIVIMYFAQFKFLLYCLAMVSLEMDPLTVLGALEGQVLSHHPVCNTGNLVLSLAHGMCSLSVCWIK